VGTKNKLGERAYVLNRSKQVQVEQVANGLFKIQPLSEQGIHVYQSTNDLIRISSRKRVFTSENKGV